MPKNKKVTKKKTRKSRGRPRKYKACVKKDGDTGYRNFYKKGETYYPKVCRYQCEVRGHRRWGGKCDYPKYSTKKYKNSAKKTTKPKTSRPVGRPKASRPVGRPKTSSRPVDEDEGVSIDEERRRAFDPIDYQMEV